MDKSINLIRTMGVITYMEAGCRLTPISEGVMRQNICLNTKRFFGQKLNFRFFAVILWSFCCNLFDLGFRCFFSRKNNTFLLWHAEIFSFRSPPPVFARRHQGLLLSGVRSGFGIRNPGATWRLPQRQHHWLKKRVQVTLTLSEPDSAMGYPGKVWKNGGFVEGLLIVENVWKSWRIWIMLIF